MNLNRCGETDLKLSELGLGCWAFGGGDYWGEVNQHKTDEIIRMALDNGINYFDTAEVYNNGRSEEALGIALKDIPRDNVIVGSKIAPVNMYPESLRQHCENSLRRLQMDYIDIYMIHWPIKSHAIRHYTEDENLINNPPSTEKAYSTLMDLRKEGKIRFIGVSNFAVPKMKHAKSQGLEFVVNQLPYNLYSRAIEYEALPYCKERGIGIIGYMSLLQALLTDKYDSIEEMPPHHRRTRHFKQSKNELIRHGEDGAEAEIETAQRQLKNLAKDSGCNLADLALNWIVSHEGIVSALVGVTKPKHLLANIEAVQKRLGQGLIDELNKITDPIKNKLGKSLDYFEATEDDRTI